MDNWLRFQYYCQVIERWSDTEGEANPGVGRPGPSSKSVTGGKSPVIMMSCDGERKTSREVAVLTLSRKASIERGSTRTVNRHR